MDIILYLLTTIQEQYKTICWLLNFICKYIPLKQWAHDDSHSPKYQKFKTDILPVIVNYTQEWDYNDLLAYYLERYPNEKPIRPVKRRKTCNIPADTVCPCCGAPLLYLYDNNGGKGQLLCKVCQNVFAPDINRFDKSHTLRCPYCGHALVLKKTRKVFQIHKCVNEHCSYYLKNLRKVNKKDLENFGKNKYKLHYIYREFTIDFFTMDKKSLPDNASSLKFSKHTIHTMSLALTYHVNFGLSLRKTSQVLKDVHGISISHQQVANYAKTASVVIKPFVDTYDYSPSTSFVADETYIKVRGAKGYIWFIMDAVSRTILGYRVSDNRSVAPCIQTMLMAFRGFKELPKDFKFIADGYSAYPLAAQQFLREKGEKFKFKITQVIGLTNDDEVSKKFRPFKQKVERLNRTFKASYRVKCGHDNFECANYSLSLWVAYYNFLRPHTCNQHHVLNEVPLLKKVDLMPAKWELLLKLGQNTIQALLNEQTQSNICS
jgi:transposase-like protein/uncharacterized protein YbaR (Trm112 family)